jgi:hypothetical protein
MEGDVHVGNVPMHTKIYYNTVQVMFSAIHDLVELQKGDVTFADVSCGMIHFRVEMYGFVWEYRFTVEDAGGNRSRVSMEIAGEATKKDDRIRRQFALLDSMIPG